MPDTVLLAATLPCLLVQSGCQMLPVGPTVTPVAITEDPSVRDRATGFLLVSDGDFAEGSGFPAKPMLTLIKLPELTRKEIPLRGVPWNFSRPDKNGNFCYVIRRGTEQGTDTRLYQIRRASVSDEHDDAIGDFRVGYHFCTELSLSDDGKTLAFLHSPEEMTDPPQFYRLSLIDIQSHAVKDVPGKVEIGTPSWFPDSQHLAFARCEVEPPHSKLDNSASEPKFTERIFVLDLKYGGDRFVRKGLYPIVSDDGQEMWVTAEKNPMLCNTRTWDPVNPTPRLPGMLSTNMLSHGSNGLVIYQAAPTLGVERTGKSEGLWTLDRRWCIKAADAKTGACATLLPVFGPGEYRYWPGPSSR